MTSFTKCAPSVRMMCFRLMTCSNGGAGGTGPEGLDWTGSDRKRGQQGLGLRSPAETRVGPGCRPQQPYGIVNRSKPTVDHRSSRWKVTSKSISDKEVTTASVSPPHFQIPITSKPHIISPKNTSCLSDSEESAP